MDALPHTLGIILAGGLARRMGGGDKGLLDLGGRAMLARAVARLAPQVSLLVLNANGDPARFAAFGVPVVADGVPGHPGPLAGVLAGLDAAAAGPGIDWVAVAPCDAPFLPQDLVAGLHRARRGSGAVAVSGGRAHPTAALWPVACRQALRRALVEEGVRRVATMIERLGFAEAEWPAEPFDPFVNVNDPEGLASAERLLARWPGA